MNSEKRIDDLASARGERIADAVPFVDRTSEKIKASESEVGEKVIEANDVPQKEGNTRLLFLIKNASYSTLKDVSIEALRVGEANSFNNFASFFATSLEKDDQKEFVESLLADSELRENWNELLKFELGGKKKDEEYFLLIQKVRDGFVSKVADASYMLSGGDFLKYYKEFIYFYRDSLFESLLLKKMDEKQAKKRKELLRNLQNEYIYGSISKDDYLEKRQHLIDEGIKQSGDEELEKAWSEVEELRGDSEELFSTYPVEEVAEVETGKEEVDDKKEVKKVVDETEMGELKPELHEDGSLSVSVGEFSFDMRVYKNEGTDEYFYKISDPYLTEPIFVRPEEVRDTLHGRHIDAFFSDHINESYNGDDSVSEVSDEELVFLGTRLIGSAGDNEFSFNEDNLMLLENLVIAVMEEDPNYGTLKSKIHRLARFVEKDKDLDSLRNNLLEGAFYNVSALIGEE